ncbi:MAG: aldehyde dehydrogenase family protein, partial [Oscillospiraceae bacterium]|nr:aldehyde dehydrogenase family protein [Oscillospiraceae bacterium]
MNNAYFHIHEPANEPIHGYMPGSKERASLKAELKRQSETVVKIPLIIGGKEVYTDTTVKITMPHDHQHVLAECCMAGEKELNMAIEAAMAAKKTWATMPWEHRASIFMKCAELLAGPWRDKLNAATMLGQSKTVFQAEIDSACELTDFARYNVYNAQELYKQQPNSVGAIWNRNEYRPLDGFVTALTPFNFTSIGGNLALAPAVMGNTVLWKPSTTATLSNYYFMRLMMEAGLPAGVINFIPCRGVDISKYVIPHPDFGGFHF